MTPPVEDGKEVGGAEDGQEPPGGLADVADDDDHERDNEDADAGDSSLGYPDVKRAEDAKGPLPPGEMGYHLEPRYRQFDRLPGIDTFATHRPLVYLVSRRNVKGIEVWAAEDSVGEGPAPRLIEDRHNASGLVADLHTQTRGDIEVAFAVHGHTVASALAVFVGGFETVERLSIDERTVGLNLETPDPLVAHVDDEQRGSGQE